MKYRIDFVLHWLWALSYGLLAITGLTLAGAKYGWLLNYDLAFADYIHRVAAAFWTIILLLAVSVEFYQGIQKMSKYSFWLIVGIKDYQLFTLFSGITFLITGMIIWGGHHGGETGSYTFSLWIHEVLTFIGLGSIIWHIYDKSHALSLE